MKMKFLLIAMMALVPGLAFASDKVAFVRCESHDSGKFLLTIETLDLAESQRINSIGYFLPSMENCRATLGQIESKLNGNPVTKRALAGICFYYDNIDYTGWMLSRVLIHP